MGLRRRAQFASGFSLPFVLIAAFVLLLSGLMLALRSSDSLLSALLQRENNDARDAAETGMTRIVAELNRPANRGLLTRSGIRGVDDDPAGHLWTSADAVRNPCLLDADDSAPDLTTNPSLGFQAGGPYREVLLNASGQVVVDASQAVKAYRLISVQRQPLRLADGRPSLRLFQADGRGTVTLVVEGSARRDGMTLSRVRLEQELQLVPKCCNTSFGGEHGNTDYGPDSDGRSVCIDSGWGFLAGAAQNDSGSLTLNGLTTIRDAQDQIVNPVSCIASEEQYCRFNPTSTAYLLQLVQPFPQTAPTNPELDADVMGSIGRETSPQSFLTATAPQPFLHCTIPGPTPTSLRQCPEGKVTLNASASTLPLNQDGHTYCRLGMEASGSGQRQVLHCNLRGLDYSQLTIEVVNTSERPLRLYFPAAGQVVHSTGGGSLAHAGDCSHLALFGCTTCGSQAIRLSGGAAGLSLFTWFPHGDLTIAGGSRYEGVIWANAITSSGGVTWTIPAAGVLAALERAGYGLREGLNPPRFDWVARSVQSFRWSGL